MNNEWLLNAGKVMAIIDQHKAFVVGNLNLEYVYCSQRYNQIMGMPDVIGKRMRDSDHIGKEYAQQFRDISLEAISNGKSIQYLVFYYSPLLAYNGFLCTTIPCRHPDTNQIVGVLTEVEPLSCKWFNNLLNITGSLLDHSTLGCKPATQSKCKLLIKLTPREQEVLFLLFLGQSYKQIANIVNKMYSKDISPSAINAVIRENLFKKFSVTSVKDLLFKATNYSLLDRVPDSISQLLQGVYRVDEFAPMLDEICLNEQIRQAS